MKNKEVYAKELVEFYLEGETFAVNKNNGRLVKCRDMACPNCAFDSDVPCRVKQKEWAEQEYEEPMLTE